MSTTIIPNLEGRTAKCMACGKTAASDPRLGFFCYQGEGSLHATEVCECGFYARQHRQSRPGCNNFRANGTQDTDSYYCGCMGCD